MGHQHDGLGSGLPLPWEVSEWWSRFVSCGGVVRFVFMSVHSDVLRSNRWDVPSRNRTQCSRVGSGSSVSLISDHQTFLCLKLKQNFNIVCYHFQDLNNKVNNVELVYHMIFLDCFSRNAKCWKRGYYNFNLCFLWTCCTLYMFEYVFIINVHHGKVDVFWYSTVSRMQYSVIITLEFN